MFLDDVDDNNGRREMTQFLILSMAGTTATFWGPSDEGRRWRSTYFESPRGHSNILKVPNRECERHCSLAEDYEIVAASQSRRTLMDILDS